jgi:hypothetical protein
MTQDTIPTDNVDLIAHHAARTGQIPSIYMDTLSGRAVADISHTSVTSFQADTVIQRYLTAKRAVWRVIRELR